MRDRSAAPDDVPVDPGITRRRALANAVAATLGLAGLGHVVGLTETRHEAAGDDALSAVELDGETTDSVSATTSLDPGHYVTYPFTLNGERTVGLHVTVWEGESVDVFVLDRSALDAYADARDFDSYESLSGTDVAAERLQDTLDAGEYVLVVDNSAAVGVNPVETAGARVEMTISG